MASLRSRYYNVGEQFIRHDLKANNPHILAILIGGSSIYSTVPATDWDGAIVVATKLEVASLVNDQRPYLTTMLGIVREECPTLRFPDRSSPLWDRIDAVRFAGFDERNMKRSVKIFSLELFSSSSISTSMRILSYKEKRIFEASRPPSTKFFRIQQATRLEDGLFILDDQWVYVGDTTLCAHEKEKLYAAFGVTADMLVSGFWLYGHEPYGQQVQRYILGKYETLTKRRASAASMSRFHRFSSEHVSWVNMQLEDLHCLPETPLSCHCFFPNRTFLCGDANADYSEPLSSPPGQISRLPPESIELYKQTVAPSNLQRPSSAFSSNSTTTEITIPATLHVGTTTKLFCKRSQYAQQETEGAMKAATYGIRVQVPHIISSGELLYPLFEGTTESELRLSYLRSGGSDWYAAETLLYAELVKAEDTLRMYSKSLADHNVRTTEMTQLPIHRFFHSRLVENQRFHEFYGGSLDFCKQGPPTAKFLEMPWNINGMTYPSLTKLFANALDVLHPQSTQMMSCPLVFGLGDAHGANIMVSSTVSPNNSREILYVDYEVAGVHPLMLDLAKPFYNDVFFETMYMDQLPNIPETKYEVENDRINVSFAPIIDDIAQAVFDIKRRYLLRPLFEIIRKQGGDLEKNILLFGNALLLCATLTRNHSRHPEAFFRNMLTGIILSQATDLESFDTCLERLAIVTQGSKLE